MSLEYLQCGLTNEISLVRCSSVINFIYNLAEVSKDIYIYIYIYIYI
jgi:hypothetical protein